MKDRQKRMLRFLLNAENNLRIEEIAAACGVGRRTVSRDLDLLESWLSLRGARLERKTNKGVRVINYGKDPAELLALINTPESYYSDLTPEQRQNFILLYMISHSREMKIAEVALTFFISDTCVWNDLAQIEERIDGSGLILQRMKGVGVRILGDEKTLRMTFLRVFAEVFSTKVIIPYIYCVRERQVPELEMNKLNLLLENLNITGDRDTLFPLVTLAEELLDVKFTVSAESFLYFYLMLAGRRIQSGCTVHEPVPPDCHDHYRGAASLVLKKLTWKTMSGPIPSGEIDLLCLLFQVCEWGDLRTGRWDQVSPYIPERALHAGQKLISVMEEQRSEQYYLDSGLEKTVSAALAALSLRKKHRIPQWYDDWEGPGAGDFPGPRTEEAVRNLLREGLGIEGDRQDIRTLFFLFLAAEINPHQFLRHKIRCLICCFEGIGLASYLYSIIRHDAPELDIVEATAVYNFDQRYLDLNRIDLVISTFPIADLDTSLLIVPLPLDRKTLQHAIDGAVGRIRRGDVRRITLPPILEEEKRELSVNHVLGFIGNFTVSRWCGPIRLKEVIRRIAEEAAPDRKAISIIEKDIQRREDLGSLILPEYGIRIFHCKSSAVQEARAGLFQIKPEAPGVPSGEALGETPPLTLMIYLVAPDPCPENIRLMLSALNVALMERPLLREILSRGDEERVRLGLFDLYHSLL